MKFVMFRTLKPRRFSYHPRYFDPEKEAMEKRRAELGIESKLSEQELLRAKMSAKWRQQNPSEFVDRYKRLSMIVYGIVILTGIYVIFFTDLIDNMIRAFGLIK
jgi:hypothetical protein